MGQNIEGFGKPSDPTEPVVAKDPLFAPGKPEHLKLTDMTASSATLEWSAPNHDGGSEVCN